MAEMERQDKASPEGEWSTKTLDDELTKETFGTIATTVLGTPLPDTGNWETKDDYPVSPQPRNSLPPFSGVIEQGLSHHTGEDDSAPDSASSISEESDHRAGANGGPEPTFEAKASPSHANKQDYGREHYDGAVSEGKEEFPSTRSKTRHQQQGSTRKSKGKRTQKHPTPIPHGQEAYRATSYHKAFEPLPYHSPYFPSDYQQYQQAPYGDQRLYHPPPPPPLPPYPPYSGFQLEQPWATTTGRKTPKQPKTKKTRVNVKRNQEHMYREETGHDERTALEWRQRTTSARSNTLSFTIPVQCTYATLHSRFSTAIQQGWPERTAHTELGAVNVHRALTSKRFKKRDGQHSLELLCPNGPTRDRSEGRYQLQWLHMQREVMDLAEFEDLSLNAPGISGELKYVVLSLFRRIRDSCRRKLFDGYQIEPGTVLRCDGVSSRSLDEEGLSATFLCFPYTTLTTETRQSFAQSDQPYPIRTVLQTLYPYESTSERDSPPAFSKDLPGMSKCSMCVPQLWAIIIGSSTFIYITIGLYTC
jgi:hypothetical protein